jgi:hypothetical protein
MEVKTSSERELVIVVEFRFFVASCKFDCAFVTVRLPAPSPAGGEEESGIEDAFIIFVFSCPRLVANVPRSGARRATSSIPGLATTS